MPSGKRISEEMRAEVLRLRDQGLTYKIISKRTGLSWNTIYKVCRQSSES